MRLIPFERLAPEKGIQYSRAQIWRKVKDGTFPKPVKAGAARNAWLDSEIDAWIDRLVAERDATASSIRDAAAPA